MREGLAPLTPPLEEAEVKRSLYCNQCRIRLTNPLTILSLKDPSVQAPEIKLQQPLVGPGNAFKSWRAMDWIGCSWDHGLNFAPQYWLNPDDVITVKQGGSRRAETGCCGPTGLDGPNRACANCSALIGTLQADCSTPIVFIPKATATTRAESDADYWNYEWPT